MGISPVRVLTLGESNSGDQRHLTRFKLQPAAGPDRDVVHGRGPDPKRRGSDARLYKIIPVFSQEGALQHDHLDWRAGHPRSRRNIRKPHTVWPHRKHDFAARRKLAVECAAWQRKAIEGDLMSIIGAFDEIR